MDKVNKIRNIMKEDNNFDELKKYSKNSVANIFLKILHDDLSSFSYDKDENVDYLYRIISLLPFYLNKNPKKYNAEETLNFIHQKIKTYLVQKPGYIDKNNHNYKLFKYMINDVELMWMPYLYNYSSEYQGSKYQFINYLIFELKSIPIFKDTLKKFPYFVNYFDKDDKNLIVTVTDVYINRVMKYTEEKGIDDIVYFDQIITLIINSPKFVFDIIDKQTILKKIEQARTNVKGEKEIKIFYLNLLVDRINKKEERISLPYLAYKYGIKIEFNPAINSEVKRIKDNYRISKGREIIDDYILSFDGEGAQEIDDALSIKVNDDGSIILGVHIADPLDLINIDSIIFEEAAKRTTSIYLSDTTIPMFPKEISTDLSSLKEKNYRPAVSFYFQFNKDGILEKYDFVQSIIKVNRNLTYSDFNHVLTMNGNDLLKQTINNLSLVSNILKNYYNVDPLYGKINRESSNITNTNIIGNSSGEKTVESSMIFTNHIVAKHFSENGFLYNYRNHVINNRDHTRLDGIAAGLAKEKDTEKIRRYIEIVKNNYPRAYNDIVCRGHDGLGGIIYGHITSPERRIEDVTNLICVYKYIFNKFKDRSEDDIKKLILKCNKKDYKKRSSIETFNEEYERLKKELD